MALKVRIPLNRLLPFVVSLPLASYVDAPATSGEALVKRLTVTNQLPFGWSVSTSLGPCTTLFKVQCTDEHPEALVTFCVVINDTLTWTLTIGSIPVLPTTLPTVPRKLLHSQQLVSLLLTLDDSKLCVGNPDEKYIISLIETHHGNLHEQTGIIILHNHGTYTANTFLKEDDCFQGHTRASIPNCTTFRVCPLTIQD